MAKVKPIALKVLAGRISAHLQRFDRDPKINEKRRYDSRDGKWYADPNGCGDYYGAHAFNTGKRIGLVYISYQGSSKLTREEALEYLTWLDVGNVGKHFDMERKRKSSPAADEFMSRAENKKRRGK